MSQRDHSSAPSQYTYKAFGLVISLPFPSPELIPCEGEADVTVTLGEVPAENLKGETTEIQFQAIPKQLLLDVPKVARFLVKNGNEVVMQRHPGATDDCLRLFLLGSVIGTVLHQRDILVLHGSTIQVGDGCVVFLGKSGAGKSTLATALRNRGYACLGDDLCAVEFGKDGEPYALPAYPQAKLWAQTLEQFNVDPSSLRRIRPSREKHALPFSDNFVDKPLPVRRLYVLSPDDNPTKISFRPTIGSSKMRVLRDYTFRYEYLEGLGKSISHFKQIAQMAAAVSVTRIVRPDQGFFLEELVNMVEQDFASLAAP